MDKNIAANETDMVTLLNQEMKELQESQKQIEEFACDLYNAWCGDIVIGNKYKWVAKKLMALGYRKIPEGAVVVLTREEYEKIYEQAEATVLSNIADGGTSCHWCMNKHEEIGYKKGSKETAEKFGERLKEIFNPYYTEGLNEAINKITKEITEGKYGTNN